MLTVVKYLAVELKSDRNRNERSYVNILYPLFEAMRPSFNFCVDLIASAGNDMKSTEALAVTVSESAETSSCTLTSGETKFEANNEWIIRGIR